MRRWLLLFGCWAAPLSAQTPDSVLNYDSIHRDSVKTYFTRVRVDTVRSLPSAAPRGIPFGPFNLLRGATYRWGRGGFGLDNSSANPETFVQQIAFARANGVQLVPQMTGGSKSNYLTNGRFDYGKWKAKQKLFDTPAIKQAVAQAVADQTIVTAELMDEPNHPGWAGSVSKALLDSMSRYTKSIFPTISTAVVVQWDWQPARLFQDVDVWISQYSDRKGDLITYRAGAIAAAKASGMALMFSMNTTDWYSAANGCPIPQTGGPGSPGGDAVNGTVAKGCRITPLVLEQTALALGMTPEVCGLLMWEDDGTMFSLPAYQDATARVWAALSGRARTPCRRS